MTKSPIELFVEAGALVRDGHFQYTSGRHGTTYVNKDALYLDPEKTSALCHTIAERAVALRPDAVVAPALGGIVLSQWVAYHLIQLTGLPVRAIYAEKNTDGTFSFRRGYGEQLIGRRVIVVEDILTTGISAARAITATRDSGAEVLGLFALWNRGAITAAQLGGVPIVEALVSEKFESWSAQECPKCRKGIALNTSLGKAGKR